MPCDFGGPCKCACVFSFLHAKLRVHRASGIPCALYVLKAREILAKLGRVASRDRGGASVLLPSLRPPKPLGEGGWRGGGGGGGGGGACFNKFAGSVTRGTTPTPDPGSSPGQAPSPQRARARRG